MVLSQDWLDVSGMLSLWLKVQLVDDLGALGLAVLTDLILRLDGGEPLSIYDGHLVVLAINVVVDFISLVQLVELVLVLGIEGFSLRDRSVVIVYSDIHYASLSLGSL